VNGSDAQQQPPANKDFAALGSERSERENELLWLEITGIRPYEHNPRRTGNLAYERIKASIQADGLAQPLVVTQRPGESDYRVAAGGNTRLQILQELHAETGDERFLRVPCLYRHWTDEADVLLAHLKENDLRGELSFLDKACAVVEFKELIAAETGSGEVTQTHLAEVLKARGYGLSQGRISQLLYTVETLLPLVPQALEGGLGRPQVERIRSLDRAARGLWEDKVRDDAYEDVFAALCRRYDAPEWDIDNLRRALEAEIAERSGISIHAVSMELEERLAGRVSGLVPNGIAAETDRSISVSLDDEVAMPGNGTMRDESRETCARPGEPASTDRQARSLSPPAGDQPECGHEHKRNQAEDADPSLEEPLLPEDDEPTCPTVGVSAPEAEGESNAAAGLSMPTDLKSLRARSWTLARRFAQRHGIGGLIAPLGNAGLGFLLSDVPDPALTEALDEDSLAQVSAVWWVLAACSEMTVAPLDCLLPAMEDGSTLKQALREQDAQLLFSRVWTPDPGHMGHRLWRRLDDRGWRELLDLMETYRQIHHTCEETGVSPWGPSK
jgi:ParB family protein of integrating conjugative element (PFGI_1 class)